MTSLSRCLYHDFVEKEFEKVGNYLFCKRCGHEQERLKELESKRLLIFVNADIITEKQFKELQKLIGRKQ